MNDGHQDETCHEIPLSEGNVNAATMMIRSELQAALDEGWDHAQVTVKVSDDEVR